MAWDILKKIGGFAFLLLLVWACGSIGGSGQCGGGGETGSCLSIDKIEPKDETKSTVDVDAFQAICNGTPELIFAHRASVTFSNKPLPGVLVTDITDITLSGYSISYSLNSCPNGSCPALPTFTAPLGLTIAIPVNGSITSPDMDFVSASTKKAYRNLGGPPFDFPSYTATYTVRGTDKFGQPVKVQGSKAFIIGDFVTCTETATTTPPLTN